MRVCVKYARVCLCVPGLSSSTVAASARQGSRHLPAHPTDARTRSQLGLRGRLLRLLPLEGVAHLAQRRLHATNEAALTRLGSVAAVAAVAAAAAAAAAAAFTARRLPVLRCWLCGLRFGSRCVRLGCLLLGASLLALLLRGRPGRGRLLGGLRRAAQPAAAPAHL